MKTELPLKDDISRVLILSAVVGLGMAVFSGTGTLLPDVFYPNSGLQEQYLANDLVNILIVVPLFTAALLLTRRGKLPGILLLPAALIFVIYNYLGYALGRPRDWIANGDLVLVLLSLIALILLLRAIDHRAVQEKLEVMIGRKLSGWILVVFGLSFFTLAVSTISTGIREGTIPPLE